MEYLRIIIHIKRVWLAVRFNCKLSFIVRNELSEKIGEIDNTYSLFKGECLVNQTMYFELPVEVVANRCKKLKLIVMMISANGMVPAGFVNFNTHPKSLNEQFQAITPIERCEDARAQIKFMHMYQHCAKIPIQNSYINHLLNKHDQNLYENGGGFAKGNQKSSHSLNRQNVSARKYRPKDSYIHSNIQKVSFSKPLVSPRTLTKHIQSSQTQKSIKVNQFQQKITQEKQLNESSINPLSKEQLMKQHQQYWLEIIRLEEQLQNFKQQNTKLNQLNIVLKNQSRELKEYYQGHQEKIHAFVGEIQENTQTIRRLQLGIQQQKYIISQKQDFQKQSQKLRETQANQLRDCLHKYADLQEAFRATKQQNKQLKLDQEMSAQKILFLQNEMKRYVQQNLQLKQKVLYDENKIIELQGSTDIHKENIDKLEYKLTQQNSQIESLTSQLNQVNHLKSEIQFYKIQSFKDQDKISNLQNELAITQQEKQKLAQESSQKDEEALLAFAKNAELLKDLQQLKKLHENQKHQSSIHSSKIKIYEKELQFTSKQRQNSVFDLRRKQEEISQLKNQLQEFEQENKIIKIKLIQYEASLSGKTSLIENLKADLTHQKNEYKALLEKNMNLQSEFQEMHSILSKQSEQKNKITILLTTIEENYRSSEEENKKLIKRMEQMKKEDQNNKQQLQRLISSLDQSHNQTSQLRHQYSQSLQKISYLQVQLQSAQLKLQQQKNNMRSQYQQSYNQSMTSLMLKYAKLQQELLEITQLLEKQRRENQLLGEKCTLKQNQIAEIKKFTHNKLTQNLKFMKQNEEFKTRLSQASAQIDKYQQQINVKNNIIQQLNNTHHDNIVKIDQLANELQFVTQVLQRERQEKSDIEKDLDHFDKADELPQIVQAQLIEESFDQTKLTEVNLQIESKVISNEQFGKDESGDKKKKKKK